MSGIDIGDKRCAVSLIPLLLVGACTYRRSFTWEGTVLVERSEAHLESEEWEESLEKTAKREEVVSKESSNNELRALFRGPVTNICSS